MQLKGEITVVAEDQEIEVEVGVEKRADLGEQAYHVEANGFVMIYAENFSEKINKNGLNWSVVDGLGQSGASLQAMPLESASKEENPKENASVKYEFYLSENSEKTQVTVAALPTHPITSQNGVRVGVSINGSPIENLDFKARGKSNEWKQNVLRNITFGKITDLNLKKGKNEIEIFWIDPGVIVDYLFVDLKEVGKGYRLMDETLINKRRNQAQ